MLYRVAGDPKIGYDLGVGTGTYGGYVRWVRTLVRVRYGGTVWGYGTGVRYGGTVWGYGTGARYGGTSYRYSVPTVPVFRKCGAISKTVRGYVVPVQCTHRTTFWK